MNELTNNYFKLIPYKLGADAVWVGSEEITTSLDPSGHGTTVPGSIEP